MKVWHDGQHIMLRLTDREAGLVQESLWRGIEDRLAGIDAVSGSLDAIDRAERNDIRVAERLLDAIRAARVARRTR